MLQDGDILASHFGPTTEVAYILSLGVVTPLRRHGIGETLPKLHVNTDLILKWYRVLSAFSFPSPRQPPRIFNNHQTLGQGRVPARAHLQQGRAAVLRTQTLPQTPLPALLLRHQRCRSGWLLVRALRERRRATHHLPISFPCKCFRAHSRCCICTMYRSDLICDITVFLMLMKLSSVPSLTTVY